jgi:hypothetical protein
VLGDASANAVHLSELSVRHASSGAWLDPLAYGVIGAVATNPDGDIPTGEAPADAIGGSLNTKARHAGRARVVFESSRQPTQKFATAVARLEQGRPRDHVRRRDQRRDRCVRLGDREQQTGAQPDSLATPRVGGRQGKAVRGAARVAETTRPARLATCSRRHAWPVVTDRDESIAASRSRRVARRHSMHCDSGDDGNGGGNAHFRCVIDEITLAHGM